MVVTASGCGAVFSAAGPGRQVSIEGKMMQLSTEKKPAPESREQQTLSWLSEAVEIMMQTQRSTYQDEGAYMLLHTWVTVLTLLDNRGHSC